MTNALQLYKKDNQHHLSESTINIYELAIKDLFAFSDKPFDAINRRDIRNWLNDLDTQGFKPATIYVRLSGVKAFYKYCKEEGMVEQDSAELIPLPEVEEKLPHYLEKKQLIELREIVKDNIEHRAIVELLYTTGVRVSELATIKTKDINWTERFITIYNGKGKKDRIVLFTLSAAEYVQAYLNERKDDQPYLFVNRDKTGPIVVRTIQLRFEKYREQLGYHFTVHTLRHTFAAHLAQKGMPFVYIQHLLGHKDPHQTQLYARLYNHAQKEKYDQWM